MFLKGIPLFNYRFQAKWQANEDSDQPSEKGKADWPDAVIQAARNNEIA